MITYLLILQTGYAAALAWTCFCRLVRTDDQTIREIRLAIWFEGVAALLVLLAPVLPILDPQTAKWQAWTTPIWVWLALLSSATLVQIATAKYWMDGVPACFLKDCK